MHTLSDKVRFVQRKLKPEEAFRTKKWMVLAEHLLAQAHIFYIEREREREGERELILQNYRFLRILSPIFLMLQVPQLG